MNACATFIRRPVLTTTLMCGLLLFGLMAYFKLPVNDLPIVDFPTIRVTATLSGASPETMASAVATPLEKQFSTIAGIDSMSSTSTQGSTNITLQFNLDRDIDAAAQDVQAAISQTQRQMPPEMKSPPSLRKENPADHPILLIALTSKTIPISQLDDYAQNMIIPRISTIMGVSNVNIYGSQKFAVRVKLDPHELWSRGIGIDEIQTAIADANANNPTGVIEGQDQAWSIKAEGRLFNAAAYRPLIVAVRNGSPVRLEELGEITDGVENEKMAAWFCTRQAQQRAIVLAVQRQPGANTIEVAQSVRKIMPDIAAKIPASVSMSTLYDRTESIIESVNDVKFTMVLTLALVVVVIFVFMRNLRATVIPALTLPLSVIATFAIMYMLRYSIDNLSLMALTLAVGFIVDDAIVMLENIFRHVEMGKDVHAAAMDGSGEVAFTIVSMTLSLAAVFIPILFMSGIVGRLFQEFAVTIGAAILISGVISLTLTPMLCNRFLRKRDVGHHQPEIEKTGGPAGRLLKFYEHSLRWTIRHKAAILLASLAILVATIWMYWVSPKGFLPNDDQGMISGTTEGKQGIPFKVLAENQQQAAAVVQADPDVDAFMSRAGGGGRRGGNNSGGFYIRLKPRNERTASAEEILQRLRGKLSGLKNMRVYLQLPQSIQIGARASKGTYQFTLQDPDTAELFTQVPKIMNELKKIDCIEDISSDLELELPEINLEINRDAAAAVGISADRIQTALYSAYGPRQLSTIYAPNDQYQVMLEVLPQYQKDTDLLSLMHLRSPSGKMVPLTHLVNIRRQASPLSINHTGQITSVTFSFNLKPGYAISQAVDQIKGLTTKELPPSISTSFQGTAQEFQKSLTSLPLLLTITIVVIYMVLAILYESFIHPLTILTALPFAGFGALLVLMIFKIELSLYAFVGIIMLVGLVKKNGIMMIDFAIAARRDQNKSAEDAIVQACIIRFRPIMMTTVAAMMAGLPIALGFGAGAEARRPLGLAVVGGLLFSQLLTLYVTPVFYVWMEKLAGKKKTGQPTESQKESVA